MRAISDLMPPDAVVTVDVGDIMVYASRFLEKKDREFIRTGRFYSMGFGLTSALAVKIARPDSEVYCILNNSCLSMIRRRQVANYGSRIIGCDFCDNDFAKIAQGFCAASQRITSMDELKEGMEKARRSELPYVLDIVVGWDESL
jgi:thiamine pyrophosphate-dependent acetolactate synthase large subunit-like protein